MTKCDDLAKKIKTNKVDDIKNLWEESMFFVFLFRKRLNTKYSSCNNAVLEESMSC